MKICYISHQMHDKGSGGAQVSFANFELLRQSQGKENVESICLSDFKYTNKITRKIVIFLRSIFGLSSCMGYFATKSFLDSDLLKKSDLIWCDCSLYGSLIKKN
ncbi:hypothetical protein AYY22_16025 [Photobacterium kishitanii]|uniref:hypothetical protein n=1 Tax=Photobacterium kishitanii TaxID=318456 RepID=UPI0007EF7A92|nr:hypothetical protein [Photobacterium kishitanii]OBU27809.1 hypothetical protein AYY22_16025 [Photobacterium kishitanii]